MNKRSCGWLFVFVLFICSLFSCRPNSQSSLLPHPETHALQNWEYHWGDLPQPADLVALEQAGWKPLASPLNPPGRNAQNWLWLRTRLPQLQPSESLYIRGIDEHFQIYLQGKQRYQFGQLPPKSNYYPGFPWHMIELSPQDSGHYLYFRIYSDYRHIGIFGEPRLGTPAAHLHKMLIENLDRVLVGGLLIFTGLLVFLLFVRQQVVGYPLLCLFAVAMGVYLISRSELKQLYFHAPAAWKWIELTSLYISVPAISLFFDRLFASQKNSWLKILVALEISWMLLGLGLAALGWTSVQLTTEPFLLLTLLSILYGVGLTFRGFRNYGEAGWLALSGVFSLFLFTGYDILVALKWVPWIWPVSHWGLLLFLISMVFLVKHQVEQIEQAKRVAEEASRVKSEFLASFSHEVRTPLNAVLGFSELLGKYELTPAEIQEYGQIIHQSGKSLLELVTDILDLSKIEAGKQSVERDSFVLSELLQEIYHTFRLEAGKRKLSWQVHLAEALPLEVTTDRSKLRQILLNLISNAFKFTPKGAVSLKVSAQPLRKGQSELIFEVQDTGSGIPEAAQPFIFKPFYQLKDKDRKHLLGAGLGLAITQQLLQLLQGHIELESQAGTGSCFRVYLPVTPNNPHTSERSEWWQEDSHAAPLQLNALPAPLRRRLLSQYAELQQQRNHQQLQAYSQAVLQLAIEQQHEALQSLAQDLLQALQKMEIGRFNFLLNQLYEALQASENAS